MSRKVAILAAPTVWVIDRLKILVGAAYLSDFCFAHIMASMHWMFYLPWSHGILPHAVQHEVAWLCTCNHPPTHHPGYNLTFWIYFPIVVGSCLEWIFGVWMVSRACMVCVLNILPHSGPAWEFNLTWIFLGQIRTDQVRTGNFRTYQVRSGQVNTGQIKSGQVHSV